MIYITCSKCGSTNLKRGKCSDFHCDDCGADLDLSTVLWGQVSIEIKLQKLGISLAGKVPAPQPCP
jgi:hypothetical protein